MANRTPDRPTATALTLITPPAAATRRNYISVRCVFDERSRDLQPQPKLVEYNLFRSAGADARLLITLEEADRDWLNSMQAEGWPALPHDFFQRRLVDSGDDAGWPEVPLRHPAATAPLESTMASRAKADERAA